MGPSTTTSAPSIPPTPAAPISVDPPLPQATHPNFASEIPNPTIVQAHTPSHLPAAVLPAQTPTIQNSQAQSSPPQDPASQDSPAQVPPSTTSGAAPSQGNQPAAGIQQSSARPVAVVQGQTITQGAPAVIINSKAVSYAGSSIYVDGTAGAAPKPTPVPQRQAQTVPALFSSQGPITLAGYTFAPVPPQSSRSGIQGVTLGNPQNDSPGSPSSNSPGNPTANGQEPASTKTPSPPSSGPPSKDQGLQDKGPGSNHPGNDQANTQVNPSSANPGTPQGQSQGQSQGKDQGNNQPNSQGNTPGNGSPFATSPLPSPAVVVKGQTLIQNAAPITVDGNILSYKSDSIYVDGTATPAPAPLPAAPITQNQAQGTTQPQSQQAPTPVSAAGYLITPLPPQAQIMPGNPQASSSAPAVIVQGQTLYAGAAPVRIGTAALAYSSGSIYVDNNAVALPTQAVNPATPMISNQNIASTVINGLTFFPGPSSALASASPIATIAGQIVAQGSSGALVVGGTILTPNAPAITIAGTPISLGSSVLVAGSSTIPLPPPSTTPFATIAGQTFSRGSSGDIVVAGTTQTPGAPAVTAGGVSVSLGSVDLVAGSTTIALSSDSAAPSGFKTSKLADSVNGALPTLTLPSLTLTPDPSSHYVTAGQTLTPGAPAVTVSGSIISVASAGTVAVIDGSTYAPATASSMFGMTANGVPSTNGPPNSANHAAATSTIGKAGTGGKSSGGNRVAIRGLIVGVAVSLGYWSLAS